MEHEIPNSFCPPQPGVPLVHWYKLPEENEIMAEIPFSVVQIIHKLGYQCDLVMNAFSACKVFAKATRHPLPVHMSQPLHQGLDASKRGVYHALIDASMTKAIREWSLCAILLSSLGKIKILLGKQQHEGIVYEWPLWESQSPTSICFLSFTDSKRYRLKVRLEIKGIRDGRFPIDFESGDIDMLESEQASSNLPNLQHPWPSCVQNTHHLQSIIPNGCLDPYQLVERRAK